MDKNVIYISTNKESFYLMVCSIDSLRSVGYRGPITAYVKKMLCNPDDISSLGIDVMPTAAKHVPKHKKPDFAMSRYYKMHMNSLSPYSKNLYVDNDTIFNKSIDPIWGEFSEDVMMSIDRVKVLKNSKQSTKKERRQTRDAAKNGRLEPVFNAGVILWKKTKGSDILFREWYNEWLKHKSIDQLALIRAKNSTGIPIGVLDGVYNCRIEDAQNIDPSITHYCGRNPTKNKRQRLKLIAMDHYRKCIERYGFLWG